MLHPAAYAQCLRTLLSSNVRGHMPEMSSLLALALAAAVGALASFLVLKSRLDSLRSEVRVLQSAAVAVERSHPGLSVTVHPFVNTNKQKGLFAAETLVEVGYKYQLLVQGLPCFEPHTVVVETTREKEVNDKTIELLKTRAFDLAQLAASAKSGGAGTAFSIAKAVVQRIR